MSKNSQEIVVDCAVPQANTHQEEHSEMLMECENSNDLIRISRASHFAVRLSLEDDWNNVNDGINLIKAIMFEKLKINFIKTFIDKNPKNLMVFLETENDAIALATFDFSTIDLKCNPKILTNNYELDCRKVKI